jgi:iron complex outermembrane receptor protein
MNIDNHRQYQCQYQMSQNMKITNSKTPLIIPLIGCLTTNIYAEENTINQADDAFGISTGQESIGIYDESSVRGFDLSSAGNYRINGSYFVKSSGTSSFFLEKTSVKIGYGAIGINFPGPSGIIDFKLRDPELNEASTLKIGLESYQNPVADILFKKRDKDNLYSFSLGVGLESDKKDEQGGTGKSALLAGTARFSPSKATKVQVFAGEYDYTRNGKFSVSLASSATKLPQEIERGQYIGQDWAIESGQRRIAGVLWDHAATTNWSYGATGVFSQEDPDKSFTQLLSNLTDDGQVTNDYIVSPHQKYTAWSGELRASWKPDYQAIKQRLFFTLRGRLSNNHFGGEEKVSLGQTSLNAMVNPVASPQFNQFNAGLTDEVKQFGLGVSYDLLFSNQLQLNMGLLYTDYQKTFTDNNNDNYSNQNTPFLFNWSVLYPLNKNAQLYSSYSKGLEESGTAPASTENRNSVLAAGIATQKEVGVRYQINHQLTAILAAFETSKPYAGINQSNNFYQTIGSVTHKGIEFSFTGSLSDEFSIVSGGVFTDAVIEGEMVDLGQSGELPVGVPKWKLMTGIMYSPSGFPQLSTDINANYASDRAIRGQLQNHGYGQLKTPSETTIDLGLRYKLKLGQHEARIRAQVLNVFDTFNWQVSSSETLSYNAPRQLRLLFNLDF